MCPANEGDEVPVQQAPGKTSRCGVPRRAVLTPGWARGMLLCGLLLLGACEQEPATLAQWVSNSVEGGRIAEAERFLERLRVRDKEGPHYQAARAEVLWKKREFAEAERAFRAAIEGMRRDKKTLMNLHFRLGMLLHEMGRYGEAETEFAGVSTFEPTSVAARVWRGRAALDATRFKEALAAFDAALRLDPNHLEARTGRAHCLIALGDLKAASAELDFLRERAPTDAWVRVLDGLLDLRKGSIDDAERSFRTAWELQKRTAFPHVALADFLLSRGKLDEAAAVLLGVPPKYAEAPGVLLRRGRLARLRGHREEARSLLARARDRVPKEPKGPSWPDPARIDLTPQDLMAAIEAEMAQLEKGAESQPSEGGRSHH